MKFIFRNAIALAAVLFVFSALPAGATENTELVMFESEGCEWCEAWNEEIGGIYDKTTEGGIAPLRRVEIDDDRPADLTHIGGIIYSPTFVVLKEGKEIGRVTGYPGEDFFWMLLNEILEKI